MNKELRILTGVDKFTPRSFRDKPDPRPMFHLRAPTFDEMTVIASLSQSEVNPATGTVVFSKYGEKVAYCCRCLVGWENMATNGAAVPFAGVRGPSQQVVGPATEDLNRLSWPDAQEIADRVQEMMVVNQPSLG